MKYRDQQKLWAGETRVGTVKVGRTPWTTNGTFMAHTSLVPVPTHKKLDEIVVARATITRLLDKARDHRPLVVVGRDWRQAGVNHLDQHLTVLGRGESFLSSRSLHPENARVLLGFDMDRFDALNNTLAGCDLRGDPWSGYCSWWRRGYPVALMAGYMNRPVPQ